LDLNFTVGPIKPEHIKTILSGPLPFFIDYKNMHGDITGSALWRMRATLRHHDRVREIAFEGSRANYNMFFRATKCTFPVLESLILCIGRGNDLPADIKLPDAFLGPDLSGPLLRRLRLERFSLASISGFLLASTTLTDLSLKIDTVFGPSPETSLLSCLQRMPRLRELELITSDFSPQPPTPKAIVPLLVPLSKLTRFRYAGQSAVLSAFAGISAPSLQEVDIQFFDAIWPSTVPLPRFFNEIEEHYYAVHVTFQKSASHLSLLTQSEYISHGKPRFNLGFLFGCMESMLRIGGTLSARLSAMEELRITFKFDKTDINTLERFIPWHWFFQQFPCVKVLHTEGADDTRIARILLQGHGPAFLPALEELELGKNLNQLLSPGRQTRSWEAELLAQETRARARMSAIQPFISARRRVGRPVKVSIIT
jgi:hypothetical protein